MHLIAISRVPTRRPRLWTVGKLSLLCWRQTASPSRFSSTSRCSARTRMSPTSLSAPSRPLAGSTNIILLLLCLNVEASRSYWYEYFTPQGLWCVSACDRCQRHPERGKPDQASDPHHPAGHREATPLGSQLYLIFFANLEIYFLFQLFSSRHLKGASLVSQYFCSLFLQACEFDGCSAEVL